jgi:PhnB protein
MRICPYVSFNGNCADAVAFYEKAFNVKAEISHYKDAPPGDGYQASEGTENLIMHAQFEVNGAMVMLCDMLPEYPVKVGENIAIMAEFDSSDKAKAAFEALKEGGEVSMEIQETFWSKCFGSLTDKFGIGWYISIGCPVE